MVAAMVPCVVGLHDPVLHLACAIMMLTLAIDSTVRARNDRRRMAAFVDDAAMFALLIALSLGGAAIGGHHGGSGGAADSLTLGEGLAVATAGIWLVARVGLWRDSRSRASTASFGLNASMVALMVGIALAR